MSRAQQSRAEQSTARQWLDLAGHRAGAVLEPDGEQYVLAVYRLDDGSRTELHAPDGTAFYAGAGRILYMGPEEMAVGVGTSTETTTVMFVRYDALGP